jgi:hypothetical protein
MLTAHRCPTILQTIRNCTVSASTRGLDFGARAEQTDGSLVSIGEMEGVGPSAGKRPKSRSWRSCAKHDMHLPLLQDCIARCAAGANAKQPQYQRLLLRDEACIHTIIANLNPVTCHGKASAKEAHRATSPDGPRRCSSYRDMLCCFIDFFGLSQQHC